jgi:hypothetical protein
VAKDRTHRQCAAVCRFGRASASFHRPEETASRCVGSDVADTSRGPYPSPIHGAHTQILYSREAAARAVEDKMRAVKDRAELGVRMLLQCGVNIPEVRLVPNE